MTNPPSADVTQLLTDLSEGDPTALDKLVPLVYEELHRIARRYMRRENAGHTLQTTALVNEAWLRLVDQTRVKWQSRAHFFGIAAQMMRRILVDHARKRQSDRAGGEFVRVSLSDAGPLSDERATDIVALDDALKDMAKIDPQQSRVVELRFFGGLTIEETAEAMGISHDMTKREWATAKAWLYREMSKADRREPA